MEEISKETKKLQKAAIEANTVAIRGKKSIARDKKATIYDIAVAVSTSSATVSRVLSNSGYPVKDELRCRIIDTAKKMNYSPNIVGRMLKKSDSLDIGVVIPTISNPFYPQMILGIELEARRRGFGILLCNSFRDPATEKKYIQSLYQKQVLGLIISSIDENHIFLKELQEHGVRIAAMDQNIEGLTCSRVSFDFIKGGLLAVEYLISLGHRNIAFLTSPLTRNSRQETMEGYRLALLNNNIEFKVDNVIVAQSEDESDSGTYEFRSGKILAQRFLELPERPTAIFAVNDVTAIGVIQELAHRNVRVPEDVSVIGFDNIEIASMITPPLTTINQPAFETGKLVCKLLLDSMQGEEDLYTTITLDPTLVIRGSTAKIG